MSDSHTGTSTGVLFVNLGSPTEPTAAAVRSFLREFLSDRRVVEIPRLVWLPILYAFILPFRPGRVAEKYNDIWTSQGSPLRANTEAMVAAVASRFEQGLPGNPVAVQYAYTYGGRKGRINA